MNEQITRLFERRSIDISELQYLLHRGKTTTLYMTGGLEITADIPLKDFAEILPEDEFWSIQKGVVVAARYVANVDKNGVYTMMDGRRLQGRQRNVSQHIRRWESWERGINAAKGQFPMTMWEKCSILDNAPIAFCVIELVFGEDGRGMDFIFRYCNRRMEDVEGVPVSKMLDRSFYEVFKNGDRKWIIPYADVALNGVEREIHDFSPEIDKNLIIHCFQPHPGYCGCFLIVDNGSSTTERA